MRIGKKPYQLIFAILAVAFCFFITSCSNENSRTGKVVFTMVPVNTVEESQLINREYLYVPGMKIALTEINNAPEPEILTGEFLSARAAEISYDGKTMVFSGQKSENDPWQIWTMDLANDEFTQITDSESNCTDPTWLPDGKIAYSKQIENETGLKYHALFSCLPDGSEEKQITFQPHEDLSASVIKDGRLLVGSKQIYPEQGIMKFLAVHPDGTKAELFYQCQNTSQSLSKAWEADDNKIYFVESAQPFSIDFNRPLHSLEKLSNSEKDSYLSAFPMENGQMIYSVKTPNELTFSLLIAPRDNLNDLRFNFSDPDYHALEPVEVRERPVPKKLPSTVSTDKATGYFICMDADRSDLDTLNLKTASVRVLGLNAVLGEAPVSEDGSFYLEISADRPIRFQSLDQNGELIRTPSSWMWVRPNERRGCVGCHEDRETAPRNVVPKAIESEPVAVINY